MGAGLVLPALFHACNLETDMSCDEEGNVILSYRQIIGNVNREEHSELLLQQTQKGKAQELLIRLSDEDGWIELESNTRFTGVDIRFQSICMDGPCSTSVYKDAFLKFCRAYVKAAEKSGF